MTGLVAAFAFACGIGSIRAKLHTRRVRFAANRLSTVRTCKQATQFLASKNEAPSTNNTRVECRQSFWLEREELNGLTWRFDMFGITELLIFGFVGLAVLYFVIRASVRAGNRDNSVNK